MPDHVLLMYGLTGKRAPASTILDEAVPDHLQVVTKAHLEHPYRRLNSKSADDCIIAACMNIASKRC